MATKPMTQSGPCDGTFIAVLMFMILADLTRHFEISFAV